MHTSNKISENIDIKHPQRSKTDLSKETKQSFQEKILYEFQKQSSVGVV